MDMNDNRNWKAKQVNNTYFVSVTSGAEIIETLTDFCEQEQIFLGYVQGLGAVSEATLRFFDPDTKSYLDQTFLEQMEIAQLNGNITQMDTNLYLHLHVTLGSRTFSTRSGHLQSAKINGACELIVTAVDSIITRKKDPELGLNLLDLD